jgi:hypothetical protein
MLPDDKKVEI